MRNLFLVSLASIFIAGCSASQPGPEPFYASPVIAVASGDTERYWVPETTRFTFKTRHFPSASQPCSVVEVEYTIDSNGNTFDRQVLDAWPSAKFAEDSIRLISRQRYLPAEGNSDRTPIRTRVTHEMQMRDVDCDRIRAEAEGGT